MELEEKELLKVNELASRLGIGERTVWRMVSTGQFPAPIRLGRCARWRWKTVEQWLEEKEAESITR